MQNLRQKDDISVEKIWLKSYPPDVPAEINPDAYQSIAELFTRTCKRFYHQPAFYNFGTSLTFSELDALTHELAAYFQQALGLQKGDRLAIMLPNILQYPVVMFAAIRAGLIVVNVNPLYTANELAFQLRDSGATSIVVLENFAHTVEKALPQTLQLKNIIITQLGDLLFPIKGWIINFTLKYIRHSIPAWNLPQAITFKKALKQGKNLNFSTVEINNQDIAFLQYTGGTTGISKGAVLTHRNIIANIQQAEAWFNHFLTENQEIIITALPLYHIFSLLANCLFFMKMGGLNVLITNPRDICFMIKEMKKFKFTAITGVNTLFNALVQDPQLTKLDFSHLHLALGGGMAVQRTVAEKWQAITKKPLLEAYGLTETSPCVSINPPNLASYNGTIGLPVSSTEVAILDGEGQELGIDTPGELGVKGPQVMQGYWHNPLETQRVFNRDGWLLTGDIASIDAQGYLRILERKKDMILVSGFNVYPNEIESVLAKIPGISEVAIVGMPDEHSGESVKAFIVKNDPALTAEVVIQYAREHLTPYKVPKLVEFRDELPKTNVGKILRRALREEHG